MAADCSAHAPASHAAANAPTPAPAARLLDQGLLGAEHLDGLERIRRGGGLSRVIANEDCRCSARQSE